MESINRGNFWLKLKLARTNASLGGKPITALAPMADVTDAAFRRIIAKYSKYGGAEIFDRQGKFTRLSFASQNLGGPDVMFTEFVSADGLCHPEGRQKLLTDLSYSEAERPIVAQLFTAHPEKMRQAAALVRQLGFDGLDINMGCPDRAVEKQGCGAALMKNSKLARELIKAAREGAGGGLPVSVKTRIGYNKNELATWLPELFAEEPAAVTIHARTRNEMSNAPARWEAVGEAVALRDRLGSRALILGNGDVAGLADAEEKIRQTGCDGAMLGRAIFGNPELFSNSRELENSSEREIAERKLRILIEHARFFDELFRGVKNFSIMKKHFKAYASGFEGAKELRLRLMKTQSAAEAEAELKRAINAFQANGLHKARYILHSLVSPKQ
ncbi:MAG: tRNA-dihydrouridine synthase [Candidatus Taylorbacteria bacterium]|nr:tRNA-dihydrouridine synthase [Candidatus Taylorbacteria bacterium]